MSAHMNEKALGIQARTQAFYQMVIKFTMSLPEDPVVDRIAPQLLDSAGSTEQLSQRLSRAIETRVHCQGRRGSRGSG